MNPGIRKRIARQFARHGHSYDRYASMQRTSADRLAELLVDQVSINAGQRVLEIGAGTGYLTRKLIGTIPPGASFYVNDLVDFSEEYRRYGIPLCGDAQSIDLPEKMDMIVSASCFQWMEDLPAFLQKMSAVLHPGGTLAFSTYGELHFWQIRRLTGQGLHYYSLGSIEQMLAQAGLSVARSEEKQEDMEFTAVREMLRYLSQTGVNACAGTLGSRRKLKEFADEYGRLFPADTGEGCLLTADYQWIVARKAE